ncbi:cation:proton antiporter [Hansschlegelia beijingensis]|uniref:cation:proton antiporter domain-containing protein n=1 Tax=Hansschlegelia beijingensis TaxID=1133344 RepID=UPI00381C8DFB
MEIYFSNYYSETLVFLAVAGLVVPLFKRLELSPVHGFLLAGLALGPFGLGSLEQAAPWIGPLTINNGEDISALAELGVVFLMFMVGLELSAQRLWLARRMVFGFGALQVVSCSVALGLLAYLLGQPPASAMVLGAAGSLSSTAIALPTLAERGRLQSVAGRNSFSILLFQDLSVAPLLLMVSVLSSGGPIGPRLLETLGPGVIAVGALVLFGRVALRPIFGWVAAARSAELFMAACLLVILGTAFITAAAGQSMALGAFVAGLLLAETEFRRQIEALVDPFKGLLLGLFFLSVGATLDLGRVFASLGETLLIAATLIAAKVVIVFLGGRAFGVSRAASAETALIMAGGGEFAFVLLSPAISGQILSPDIAATATAAVTISMLTIPFLIAAAGRFAARTGGGKEVEVGPPDGVAEPVVVIAGYGRKGAVVARMLARHDVPFIAVDDDVRVVRRARRQGDTRVFYGDATNPEMLRRCGVASALALVVTPASGETARAIVASARAESETLPVFAFAGDLADARRLYRLGVTDAVPLDVEPSLHLSELVLLELGLPMGNVIASVHEQRDEFRDEIRPKGRGARHRNAIRAQQAGPP